LGVGLPLSGRVNVEFRNCYSLFSIRKHPSTGDIYRFFGYGQFNNVITLLLTYQL
jgi:hypothetical protein